MRLWSNKRAPKETTQNGFTLIEVLIGMAIVGGLIITLYTGLAWGFRVIRLARENIRATQVMAEKMETIRLYNWDQVTSNGFIPSTFNVPYYPVGQTNGSGVIYHGTMTVTNATLGTSYDPDMRRVIVTLNWTTGQLPRTRTIETYVSRYGLQNYVY
ncbi:MAG: hypothetical protein DME26_12950 [Verrucomicrobia bacterium]|nr:MAG: hypothetical protein DME26_12950 [Verrucomicrobiota bacterium]